MMLDGCAEFNLLLLVFVRDSSVADVWSHPLDSSVGEVG